MPSIIDMPELVMENIIWFSDFRSVLTLRQVCRDFRNFIDDLNDSKLPDSKFEMINLYAENSDNPVHLDFWESEDSIYRFEYSESESSRTFKEKKTILENSDIVDVVIGDLELVLKFQKSILKRLDFCFNDSQLSNDSSIPKFLVKLRNMIEKINQRIKTESLKIDTYHQSQMMPLFPLVDPDALIELELYTSNDDRKIEMNEVVKTEQWKKAERFDSVTLLLNLNVEDICHFSWCALKTNSITARDLDFLKKTYISSSKFESAFFQVENFNGKEEIFNLWGPAFTLGSESHRYFRMKNCEKKILHIKLDQDNEIQFDVVEMKHVPNEAIVHN